MSNQMQLNPEVMVLLGLRQQPFAVPGNLTDIYPTQCLQSLCQRLECLLLSENKLAIVTGESGMGSSVLAKYLTLNNTADMVYFLVQGHPSLNSTEILFQIGSDSDNQEQFKETAASGKSISKFASSHLFHLMKKDRQPVIIIDQAHAVNPRLVNDIVRFCEAVNSRNRGLIKLVLIYTTSQQQTVENLFSAVNSEWIKNKQYTEFAMQPLKKNEAKKYLVHRFKKAGLSVKLPFTEQTIMVLASRCRGILGTLDKLVVQSLNSRAHSLVNEHSEPENDSVDQEEGHDHKLEIKEKLFKLVPVLIVIILMGLAALATYMTMSL